MERQEESFSVSFRYLRHVQHAKNHRALFLQGTQFSQPHGGLVLWVELNPKVDVFELRADAVTQHISFMPGKIFSASCNFSHCLRISFGKPWNEDMDWELKLLGDLVKKQLK